MKTSQKKNTVLPGVNCFLHGGDYNPDQWLDRPEVIDEDFRLMSLAGCSTFSIGVFSWTSYEREEGVYCFDWLDRIMDRMAGAGHQVILATPSGAKPAWLSARYPEIRRVGVSGLRDPHKTRHNHCWTSPVYRQKVQAVNAALAERYKGHPALAMWHISNEYNGPCYCNLCIAGFHEWLQKKYGSLENLNRRWWTAFWNHTFTEWDQIDPRDYSIDALLTDWSRFHTDQVISFYRAERDPLQRITPEIPKTTNLMGFFQPINYWKFVQELDVIADDSYPALDRSRPDLWKEVADLSMTHSFLRTAARPTNRPWMLMESAPSFVQWKSSRLKAPGMHRAEVMNAVAQGAEGVLYFQWRCGRGGFEKFHAAVVDHSGTETTRVFRDVAETGRCLSQMTEVLGSEVKAEVAVVYDWESRWQLRDSCGMLSHSMIRGQDAGYNPEMHYRELWKRSVPADVISVDHDFSAYRLVIAPQLFMLKPGMAEKIEAYVKNGGVFVGTYYTGYVDEDGLCFEGGRPGGGLRKLFGVWNEEYDLLPEQTVLPVRFMDGAESGAEKICELVHVEGASVVAEYTGDFYKGMPAVTQHRYGKGSAFYVAAELVEDGMARFYDIVVETAGVRSVIECRKPVSVSVSVREHAESDACFVFITNWSADAAEITFPEEVRIIVPDGSELAGRLNLTPFETVYGRLIRR
ncbi:MAG: beta-galactosidase [Kiritimatiellales bacterium]